MGNAGNHRSSRNALCYFLYSKYFTSYVPSLMNCVTRWVVFFYVTIGHQLNGACFRMLSGVFFNFTVKEGHPHSVPGNQGKKTPGGLKKSDLIKSKSGRIVSLKRSENAKKNFKKRGLDKWITATQAARDLLDMETPKW